MGIKEVAMYAVIRQYQIPLDAVEAVTRQVCEGFAPFVSRVMPGFVEYYWIDTGDGELISLSIFEDEAIAKASTQIAGAYARDHLSKLVIEPPTVIEGEVIVRVDGKPGENRG